MDYREYQNSRNAAWQVLIDCRVTQLPVRVTGICKHIGVPVRSYTPPGGGDGCSVVLGGRPVILISDRPPTARRRFTAAHELGHIMLGHLGECGLLCREEEGNNSPLEQSANAFAARLLAPSCVLWGCGVTSAEEIRALCDISRTAAELRWQRLQQLYRRGRFLRHPLERQVYRQFAPYIRENRLRPCAVPAEREIE